MTQSQTTTELSLEEKRSIYKQHLNRERAKINSKVMALRRDLHTLDNCEGQYEDWYLMQANTCEVHVKPDVLEMLTGVAQ